MHRWTSRTAVLGGVLGLALRPSRPVHRCTTSTTAASARSTPTGGSRRKPDDGRIRVEGEVDSDRSGRSWKWKIFHDGAVSYHGRAKTDGGGSFKVERRVVDAPGYDVDRLARAQCPER